MAIVIIVNVGRVIRHFIEKEVIKMDSGDIEIEINSNTNELILEELQTQTLILEDIKQYKEEEKNNFDLYFPIVAVPLFVVCIFKLFLRW